MGQYIYLSLPPSSVLAPSSFPPPSDLDRIGASAMLENALLWVDKGWNQKVYGLMPNGLPARGTQDLPLCVSWCMVGALQRAQLDGTYNQSAVFLARWAMGRVINPTGIDPLSVDVGHWNDRPDRTKEEVIEKLQETIKLVWTQDLACFQPSRPAPLDTLPDAPATNVLLGIG